MIMEWQVIQKYQKPEFVKEKWFHANERILVTVPWICIASYSYTEKGKGRFRNEIGICHPTHWMPLPALPTKEPA